jgi:molybdopterin synthase sulfur carrier subunit
MSKTNPERIARKPVSETINVQVRTFASLRQVLGTANLSLDLPPNATVAHLLERLSVDYPAAGTHLRRALVAINQEYVDPSQSLEPDDEVVVFPPVSGGESDATTQEKEVTFVGLSADPIDPLGLSEMVSEPGSGCAIWTTRPIPRWPRPRCGRLWPKPGSSGL